MSDRDAEQPETAHREDPTAEPAAADGFADRGEESTGDGFDDHGDEGAGDGFDGHGGEGTGDGFDQDADQPPGDGFADSARDPEGNRLEPVDATTIPTARDDPKDASESPDPATGRAQPADPAGQNLGAGSADTPAERPEDETGTREAGPTGRASSPEEANGAPPREDQVDHLRPAASAGLASAAEQADPEPDDRSVEAPTTMEPTELPDPPAEVEYARPAPQSDSTDPEPDPRPTRGGQEQPADMAAGREHNVSGDEPGRAADEPGAVEPHEQPATDEPLLSIAPAGGTSRSEAIPGHESLPPERDTAPPAEQTSASDAVATAEGAARHGTDAQLATQPDEAYVPVELTPDERAESQRYFDGLPRAETPNTTPANAFERRHTGDYNYALRGAGEAINADGYRVSDAGALEAKHVGNPARSPFVDESSIPEPIRQKILAQEDDEFRRYGQVVADPSNPVRHVEVITNDPRAIPYFRRLMAKYDVPGHVIVKS